MFKSATFRCGLFISGGCTFLFALTFCLVLPMMRTLIPSYFILCPSFQKP